MKTGSFTWQQHCAVAFGRGQSQLVKSHHLTTCLQNPAAGTISESQSTDLSGGKKKNQNLTTELHCVKKNNKFLPWAWGCPEAWRHQWRFPQQQRFCSRGQPTSSYGSKCKNTLSSQILHTYSVIWRTVKRHTALISSINCCQITSNASVYRISIYTRKKLYLCSWKMHHLGSWQQHPYRLLLHCSETHKTLNFKLY